MGAMPVIRTPKRKPLHNEAGFGLIDVLVGLVLLAVALLGACATLVQSMHATHAMVLQTRAVDLAADLAEDLHPLTVAADAAPLIDAWRHRVLTTLPVSGLAAAEFAGVAAQQSRDDSVGPWLELQLRWRNARDDTLSELAIPAAVMFRQDGP